ISVDRWDFSALAGQQVRLHVVAASGSDIQFDLTGPSGYTGFTGLSADSPELTLPANGTYTLTVHDAGEQSGAYAFEVQAAAIDLALGTPFHGTLAGGGQTQLFRVQVPTLSPLLVDLRDPQPSARNEVYLKFGAPPTRADYDLRSSSLASADQVVAVP